MYPGPLGEIAARIAEFGPRAVIVTLGPEGALANFAGDEVRVEGRSVDAIDTTGAGDAFMAAVITEIVRSGFPTDGRRLERNARVRCGGLGTHLLRLGGLDRHPHQSRSRSSGPSALIGRDQKKGDMPKDQVIRPD